MAWTAQVWVKWNGKFPQAKDWGWLKDWPEVKAAWSVMGDWDMILDIDAKSPDQIEDFVTKKLRSKDWVAETRTHWNRQVWQRSA